MIIDSENFVEHYGRKGMRWGIRKNYADKQSNLADRLDRVASGKATAADRLLVTPSKKIAARQSEKIRDQVSRIERGEATVRDMLSIYGSMNIVDVINARRLVKASK